MAFVTCCELRERDILKREIRRWDRGLDLFPLKTWFSHQRFTWILLLLILQGDGARGKRGTGMLRAETRINISILMLRDITINVRRSLNAKRELRGVRVRSHSQERKAGRDRCLGSQQE